MLEPKPLDTRHQHARQEIEPSGDSDSGSLVWYLFLVTAIATAGIAAYILFIEPALSNARKSANDFAKQVELIQLQTAIESYKIQFGKYPPDSNSSDVKRHLSVVLGPKHDLASLLEKTKLDLSKLDEREALWFWLSGQSSKLATGDAVRGVIYDFRPGQLADQDQDGLMEYTSADGEYFILRDGKVLLLDPVTNQTRSADDYQNK